MEQIWNKTTSIARDGILRHGIPTKAGGLELMDAQTMHF